ncbi:MAG: alpha-hydroxy-acid oxidizing protein [Thermodesulfovibrionales bacterium]|nr:alpha-hydroxy-acid oxidizing protein [Thermodesulfovibrionales bacterium]
MDIKTIKTEAAKLLKPYCRCCPHCDGKACAGEVPGMGGVGTGQSFIANVEALKNIKLNMRTIHEVKVPKTTIELWGHTLSMPIISAPITGVSYNMGGAISEEEFTRIWTKASVEAGTIAMTGDGADPTMFDSGCKAIKEVAGKGIAIIKPRANDEIIRRIKIAEETGAIAVGIDIDGAGLITMALKGQPVSPKSPKEIEHLVKSTSLPFIVKGIMTPIEARICAESGASAIVVSNHGGRVLDQTPGTAEVLPKIVDSITSPIKIFVDGGIRSGVDVLKMLALGAHCVLIGRPLIISVFGGGKDAMVFLLNKYKTELTNAMLLTGASDVGYVSRSIIEV